MPIYEFKCQDCDRLTSIFVRTPSAEYKAVCRHCGSRKLSRVISGFSYHKSEQTILQEYGAEPKALEDYRAGVARTADQGQQVITELRTGNDLASTRPDLD